ncbi:immunity 8 family protein [Mycetohabitans sp. B8]|uniref:immunity 8 family protein n=1 Tax=Mycetohabitans sp. B8 TaxID=2841845 RepID=UPI001F2C9BDE|nr:immunity 8 family protein [Mycetohabitans sp. B8]MCG1041482.1 immunity 8 family protein [Mycetohabitans sp. B8]
MRAVLKGISCDECNLKEYVPEDRRCFFLNLHLCIGLIDKSGADNFELYVCTPEWLNKAIWEPKWGRYLLIVQEYDLLIIEEFIRGYIEQCDGADWNAIVAKLARMFAWEFEDYQA